MKMANMKMSAAEKKAQAPTAVGESKGPEYPYGLRINLGDDAFDKLGMDMMPKVGSKLKLHAAVEVVSTAQDAGKHGSTKRVELQITDMALMGKENDFERLAEDDD